MIVVADDGPGMAPEQVAHVFERFYRSDPSRSRLHGGAGLGLSIVSAIVAAHGGTVSAASAPGQGTTFTVRLPAAPPEVPPRSCRRPPDSPESTPRSGRTDRPGPLPAGAPPPASRRAATPRPPREPVPEVRIHR